MEDKSFLREFVKAWRDWEGIFGREYAGVDFNDKFDAFIRWLDLNTKEQQ